MWNRLGLPSGVSCLFVSPVVLKPGFNRPSSFISRHQNKEGGAVKFRIRALALAVGLMWGAGIFIVGVANLASAGYGSVFLQLLASVYPGYSATASFGQVIIATLYGLVDGAIGGAIFAWLYNTLSGVFQPQ
jgi:hypothetical protein